MVMTKFKYIMLAIIVAVLSVGVTKYIYGNETDKLTNELRKEREKNAEIVSNYSAEIGVYQTKLATQESNLKEASSLLDSQISTIKELEKELDSKVEMINALEITVTELQSSGIASITVASGDSVTYKIDEYKEGVSFKLTLQHPSGEYTYTIKQDPISMELYVSKEKGTGLKVGTVRFPNNPNLTVSEWNIIYDPDTRAWYQRIWDNTTFQVGAFGGRSDAGIMGFLGYKKVSVGPVWTEEGASIGVLYKVK